MKPRQTSKHRDGAKSAQDLIAQAKTTQLLADAARKHFKMLKAEQKEARIAFKQAKKAAKRARKEAKAAARLLKSKNGSRTHRPKTKTAPRRNQAPSTIAAKRPTSRTTIPLPAYSPPSISVAE